MSQATISQSRNKSQDWLARDDPGINRLDKIAKQHNNDYSFAKNLTPLGCLNCNPIVISDCNYLM